MALQDVPGWAEFNEDTQHIHPDSWLYAANRFCHKVYAQLDAFESRHRYVIWLDADTVIKKKFGQRLIKRLLDGEMCAFLGRQGCYTETGFIAFDTHHPDFPEFKKRYSEIYNERLLFLLDYWIDCVPFDIAKDGLSANNLTPHAQGMIDVFPLSPLDPYIDHDKGETAKAKRSMMS